MTGPRPSGKHEPRWRPTIGFLLALVVLFPTTGMAYLSTSSARTRWSQRGAAGEVNHDAVEMHRLIVFHGEITTEYVNAASISTALDLGLNEPRLSALYHVDFAARMRLARDKVDADTTAREFAELEADMSRLRRLRLDLDAGRAPFSVVNSFFKKLDADIDALWQGRLDEARRLATTAEQGGGLVLGQLDVMQATSTAFHSASQRIAFTNELLVGTPTPAKIAALIAANTRFSDAVADFSGRLGPNAASAWRKVQLSPSGRQFDAVVEKALRVGLAGGRSPLATDPTAYGAALIEAGEWVVNLTTVTAAASTDLTDVVRRLEADAVRSFIVGIAAASIAIALAAAAAALTARAVSRPAGRLAASARRISMGEFSIPPLPGEGPRELAETSRALNEMASTLTALERYAIALAEDPRSPTLRRPLPGRTGQALQETLDHLRDSVHDGERHRLALLEAATHDGLTGLLNRAAAMDALTRDLSRSERNGTPLMILFIDIDSFKSINDTYGHHVGDDALRLTADALRMATRLSDVVARFGGDEFLVCGFAADRAEVGAIAQRVHDAIALRSIPVDDGELTMHSSIGIAMAGSGDTADSLMRKADQALYVAKRSGRDQVVWHRPDSARASTATPSSSAPGLHTTRLR